MARKKIVEIVLDIETTGLDYKRERIIEFAAIRLENGKEVARYETLINPKQHIRKSSMQIHGITEEMVENERERQKELLLYKEKKLYFNDCIKLIDNQNIDAAKMNHFLKSFISKIEYYDNSFNDMNKYNLKIYLKI